MKKSEYPIFIMMIYAMLVLNITHVAADTEPVLNIKGNESTKVLTLTPTDPLSLKVDLDPGSLSGIDANWWVYAKTPTGNWFSWIYPTGWVDVGTNLNQVLVSYKGPLFALNPYEVLNISNLAEGEYDVYFGIDTTNTNGLLDSSSLKYDMLKVTVRQAVMVDQGSEWTESTRQQFYTEDQGSRVMPLKWMQALKQSSGQPFMADSLSRYGYLPNPKTPNIPIGFSVASEKNGDKTIGMTCSACHTRQIEVSGTAYRIDGGPALADLQAFEADLDNAVNNILSDTAAFTEFVTTVLGHVPSASEENTLRSAVQDWFLPYHTLMSKALPTQSPWGLGRVDAVSMIFNRLTGLDIGEPPTYMIPENIIVADAPVRLPFLWNVPFQDYTQWPGFAPNGNPLLGLLRNFGEVTGVFSTFHPKKDENNVLKMNYVENNSANFAGLNINEDLMTKLGAPKWPWTLDPALVAAGELVFNKSDPNADNQSCASCHGIKDGESRSFAGKTWATPILDVGTDSREIGVLGTKVKTGVMENAKIFYNDEPIESVDLAIKVLGVASQGSIIQHYFPALLTTPEQVGVDVLGETVTGFGAAVSSLEKDWGGFGLLSDFIPTRPASPPPIVPTSGPPIAPVSTSSSTTASTPSYAYEARVLKGIWAVAPYLHNGSVPTLAELLKPSADRVATFKVGPAYDIDNVGLTTEQTRFNYTYETTDCSDRNSGNSRCGHEYGTTFTETEKKALLEYLKSLY